MPLQKSKVHFHNTKKQWAASIIGILLAVGGLTFAIVWPHIFYMMMEKEMALRPNSRVYESWKSPPITIILDIYFFNWTNPESIHDPNIKPKFEEIGPYRFIDKPEKVNITWHPENSTISYQRKNFFISMKMVVMEV